MVDTWGCEVCCAPVCARQAEPIPSQRETDGTVQTKMMREERRVKKKKRRKRAFDFLIHVFGSEF